MHNLFSILEFIFVFAFLILPSLLVSENQGGTVLDFSRGYKIVTFILFLVSVLIFWIERKVFDGKRNDGLLRCARNDGEAASCNNGEMSASNDEEAAHRNDGCFHKYETLLKIGTGTLCFGLVLLVAAVFEAAGFFIDGSLNKDEVIFPENAVYFVNFVLGTFAAAFSEEISYRFYLPRALKRNFKILTFGKFDSEKSKTFRIFFEIISVLVFAFSHRYLGFLAVLNAFFSGAILRFCMIKTKSVFVPASVHFVYNLCVFAAIRLI